MGKKRTCNTHSALLSVVILLLVPSFAYAVEYAPLPYEGDDFLGTGAAYNPNRIYGASAGAVEAPLAQPTVNNAANNAQSSSQQADALEQDESLKNINDAIADAFYARNTGNSEQRVGNGLEYVEVSPMIIEELRDEQLQTSGADAARGGAQPENAGPTEQAAKVESSDELLALDDASEPEVVVVKEIPADSRPPQKDADAPAQETIELPRETDPTLLQRIAGIFSGAPAADDSLGNEQPASADEQQSAKSETFFTRLLSLLR